MSEKYYNAYVDASVGMIHELIASTLQLKAQVRVINDLIAEKDSVISNLQTELTQSKETNTEIESLRRTNEQLQNTNNGLTNKVSHMETLTKQYNDMKQAFLLKCQELEELRSKPKSTKKVINNKEVEKETNVDDF
jgi:SMC interacting uncharacterized protein involved in chromosome segregation